MRETFTIKEYPAPVGFRIASFFGGVLLLTLGVLTLVRGVGIVAADAPLPPFFAAIALAMLLGAALGAAMIWAATRPLKIVVIDSATQEVRVTYRYPFGILRHNVYPLAQIGPPDIKWQRNSDHIDDGYWQLRLTLPDGRIVKRVPEPVRAAEQKQQADVWKAEIQAMRR